MTPARDSDEVASEDDGTPSKSDSRESFRAALQPLIAAAVRDGRDWKFVDGLLVTITDIIAERGRDVFVLDKSAPPGMRLLPEFRARITAVIDSLSDDETADFLQIGKRQVRRRAQRGDLHYFILGKRRRYPVWQFDELTGGIPGLRAVLDALSSDWPPERLHFFMTTTVAGLEVEGLAVTPHTWLVNGLDPARIVELILDVEEPPRSRRERW